MNVIGETCQKKKKMKKEGLTGRYQKLESERENFGFVFLMFYLTKR